MVAGCEGLDFLIGSLIHLGMGVLGSLSSLIVSPLGSLSSLSGLAITPYL